MYMARAYQCMGDLEVHIGNVYMYNISRVFVHLKKLIFIRQLSISQYNSNLENIRNCLLNSLGNPL